MDISQGEQIHLLAALLLLGEVYMGLSGPRLERATKDSISWCIHLYFVSLFLCSPVGNHHRLHFGSYFLVGPGVATETSEDTKINSHTLDPL